MMGAEVLEIISAMFLVTGAFFFLAGTVGLLRFPDLYTRLHALTKADNLGLGFIVLGLAVTTKTPAAIAKLGIIWVLVLASSSIAAQLIASHALARGKPSPGGSA
jgi:multicomponent Na+:H+ antiporter subunit G